jgi:uroporphyrinogen-III synthase
VRVIVTRPAEQSGPWIRSLIDAGFDALSMPLIEIAAAIDQRPVVDVWQRLHQFDAAMFVSANAVRYFFAGKPTEIAAFNGRSMLAVRAWGTGPGTVAALLDCAVDGNWVDAPDAHAGQFDSEALWQLIQHRVIPGFRCLIVRGADGAGGADSMLTDTAPLTGSNPRGVGRDWFSKRVDLAGGTVEFVVTYQRRAPVLDANALALAKEAAYDGSVWLFSSSEALANLQALCPGHDWSRGRAVATHPRIAGAARAAGFGEVCESRPSLSELVASIESLA